MNSIVYKGHEYNQDIIAFYIVIYDGTSYRHAWDFAEVMPIDRIQRIIDHAEGGQADIDIVLSALYPDADIGQAEEIDETRELLTEHPDMIRKAYYEIQPYSEEL